MRKSNLLLSLAFALSFGCSAQAIYSQPITNLTGTSEADKSALRHERGQRELVLLSVTDSPELLRSGEAEIVLEAHDVWKDGSGYQILLDADHDQFGQKIPTNTYTLYQGCDIPADYYTPFEYTVPEKADPSCMPQHMVVDDMVSVKIPAGTYDYVIAAPQANVKIWIPGGETSRADDYVFEAGKKYHFLMQIIGQGDASKLTVTGGESPEPAPITDLKANKDNNDVVLTWNAPTTTKVAERIEMGNRQVVLLSVTDSPELLRSEEAEIVLEAHNVWKDGSGYQILLDANHDQFGQKIPAVGALYKSCDIPADYYSSFEYTVPEKADPSCMPQHMVVDDMVSVKIPAGTYDYVIAAPQAGAKIWVAGGKTSRADDYAFEAGKKYHFLIKKKGQGDSSELTISGGGSTPDYTYTVYRDGTQVAAGLAETTYKDLGMAANNHEYCVQVKYTAGESAKVCVNYVASSIEDVTAAKPYSIAVTGKTITVTSNGSAMIYDMNGRRVAAGSQVVSYTAQSEFYAVRISVDGKTYVERLAVK